MPSFREVDFDKAHIAAFWFKEWGDTYLEMITYILSNPIDSLYIIIIAPRFSKMFIQKRD